MIHWRARWFAQLAGAFRLARVVSEALVETQEGGIVHDPRVPGPWTLARFSVDAWRSTGRLREQAIGGRGAVVFLASGATADGDDSDAATTGAGDADDGEEWALRHYHRGGLPGRLLDDRFSWAGASMTRSFREWRLLCRLHNDGLPVPRPVAAAYRRRGLTYTADLITARIPGAEPLVAHLVRGPIPAESWRRLGRCIRRFHDAGVFHADLNVHNLLLDESSLPWLLDFDRGRMRPPGGWCRANLERFARSLRKTKASNDTVHVTSADWAALLAGYGQMPA